MFHTLSPSAGYPLTFSPITHACLKAPAANWRGCPLKSKESRRKVMSFWPSGRLCVPPQTCSNACQPTAWIALLRNAAHLNLVVFNGCARVNLLKLQAETHQADWGIKACPPNRSCVIAAFALKTQSRADLQLYRRDSIDKYVCMCSSVLNECARPLLCLCLYAFLISDGDLRLWCCRVTPQDGDASPSGADEPTGATGGAGAMAISASSTLSLPVSQGKPSLRRIKGRIHRSKSLDSIDLLDSSVRPPSALPTPVCPVPSWLTASIHQMAEYRFQRNNSCPFIHSVL